MVSTFQTYKLRTDNLAAHIEKNRLKIFFIFPPRNNQNICLVTMSVSRVGLSLVTNAVPIVAKSRQHDRDL